MLGAMSNRGSPWMGLAVGGLIGVFFGLVFEGGLSSLWADFLGPEEPGGKDD